MHSTVLHRPWIIIPHSIFLRNKIHIKKNRHTNVHNELSTMWFGLVVVEKMACEAGVGWLCNTFVRHCIISICVSYFTINILVTLSFTIRTPRIAILTHIRYLHFHSSCSVLSFIVLCSCLPWGKHQSLLPHLLSIRLVIMVGGPVYFIYSK